jgi:TRAP-type C4-dicarboxylate transport system permease small subunit
MTPLGWQPRDWRALLALVASVAGAAVLTGFAAWVTWILWRGGWSQGTEGVRIDALAKALLSLLLIVGIVLVSLGLAINRRQVKATLPFGAGFEASGGEDESAPESSATVTTTTTVGAAKPLEGGP